MTAARPGRSVDIPGAIDSAEPVASVGPVHSPEPRLDETGIAGIIGPEGLSRWGSPAYVYDLDVVTARAALLRATLPDGVGLAYAMKANPALAVVGALVRAGLGLDVASGGEVATAAAAGADPATIVMTGPGKTDADLAAAVRFGVGHVTLESVDEAARVAAAVRRFGAGVQRVLLRAWAPGAGERAHILGDAAKFGMTRDELGLAVHAVLASPELELDGLHAFGASNVLDAGRLGEHADQTVALGIELARRHSVQLRVVDIGGGLGIPYADDEPRLDIAALGSRLAATLATAHRDPAAARLRILAEPGRWLVGPAGAYVATVVETKQRDGVLVTVLDGGIHGLLRPVLVGTSHRARLLGADAASPNVTVALVGPLCTGLDVLDGGTRMPAPGPGALVAFLDAGAYGFTESMPLFLSHPRPAEVASAGGRVACIRPREMPEARIVEQLDPFRP